MATRNLPAARQSKPPATQTTSPARGRRTINVTYNINDGGTQNPSGGTGAREGGGFGLGWVRGTLAAQPRQASVPKGVPRLLGNGSIVAYAWIVAMVLVGFDEWKNNGILPRPARLWDTSIVYGLLVLLSFIDVMMPLANALAIGYTIVLLWQYYNGTGQFGESGHASTQRQAAAGEGSGGKL
jgi:hypothetical protein